MIKCEKCGFVIEDFNKPKVCIKCGNIMKPFIEKKVKGKNIQKELEFLKD